MARTLVPLLAAGAATLLYGATAAVGPMWADSSKLTLYALRGYFPSLNPGDHPGWTLAAWLWLAFAPGDPVAALHLFSSFSAGLSVGFLMLLLEKWGLPPARVWGAALLWALSHSLWWAGTLTETYPLAYALTLASALASGASPARSFFSGCLLGWAAATHGLSLFLTLPLVLAGKPRFPWALLGAVAGTSPCWLALGGPQPDPLTGFVSATATSWGWHLTAFLSPRRALEGLALVLGLVAFNVGPLGAWKWCQNVPNPVRWGIPQGLAGTTTLLFLFLTAYSPFRLHLMVGFLLLALLLWRPPALTTGHMVAHLVAQLGLYLGLPSFLAASSWHHLQVRVLPYRNNAQYFLSPLKRWERGPELYGRDLLQKAPAHAVILADFNPGALLSLLQEVEGLRPDVEVVPTVVDQVQKAAHPPEAWLATLESWRSSQRPLLLADTYEPYYQLEALRQAGYVLRPCGPGVLVEWHGPSEGDCPPT